MKEDIDKFISLGVRTPEKQRKSIMRRLMCRLIDVEEEWPFVYHYDNVSTWLQDFINGEEEYSFELKVGCKGDIILSATDFFNDHAHKETVKIPTFLLKDDWKEQIQVQKKHSRLKELDKEIQKLNDILANAPTRLLELKEEKHRLEVDLNS